MRNPLAAFVTGVALLLALPAAAEDPAAKAGFTDYSNAFVTFYDATEGLDTDARVAAFKAQVAPVYPAFYAPRDGRTQADVDANIRRSIEEFPGLRAKYLAAQSAFPAALAGARKHFRQTFPDSTATLPIYLLHSLGEMDGGTREIDGRQVMVFGADGIARYHTPEDLGPFFDHELFHIEHRSYFGDCDAIWCQLWREGLATAAAAQMNPGISNRALMLELPKPIAPAVDAHWREALCDVDARKDSLERDDYKALFWGNGGTATLPPRWGYYVGYRLAAELLEDHGLVELAHMPDKRAEPLVKAKLATMIADAGGCRAPA
jgi:hypothetical protein